MLAMQGKPWSPYYCLKADEKCVKTNAQKRHFYGYSQVYALIKDIYFMREFFLLFYMLIE